MKVKYIVGIDEVGRGPIAGPVCVASFAMPITNYELLITNFKEETKLPLRDSKKLSKIQREKWFKFLRDKKEEGLCDFSVSFVASEMIDNFGIVKAIQKALNSSLLNLTKTYQLQTTNYKLFLDGGLKAPEEFINQETIIRGDELHPVISCASIVAKVSRDRIMHQHSLEYPEYGFDKHVGYGTKAHYEAIKN